jgi:serine/threonine protein kinase
MPRFKGIGILAFQGGISRIGKLGIDLINRMLKVNPRERISCCEALRHPYFSAVSDNMT